MSFSFSVTGKTAAEIFDRAEAARAAAPEKIPHGLPEAVRKLIEMFGDELPLGAVRSVTTYGHKGGTSEGLTISTSIITSR